jgi:phenylacetaldehyde dehydrogenase
VNLIRYFAGWTTKIEGTTTNVSIHSHHRISCLLRQPIGVVGQIIPWLPVMAALKLAPALPVAAPVS